MDSISMKNSNSVPAEELRTILQKGFYYIKNKDIHFEPDAVFVGNGYHDYMIRTHYLNSLCDGVSMVSNYIDWAKEEDIFDFRDYGKTWHVDKEVLEEVF